MSELSADQKANRVRTMRRDMEQVSTMRRRAVELEQLLESYSRGEPDSTEITRGGGIRSWFTRRGQSSVVAIELSKEEQAHLRAWVASKATEYRESAARLEEKVALGGQ